MATTTPNYGWPVPTSTDYVKDGATAIEALGNAIDTTVAGLGSGLTLLTPASIARGASGSASVNSDGTVIFSGTESISLNGVFSSAYENYKITISVDSIDSGVDTRLRFRTAGTDKTAASYSYNNVLVDIGSTMVSSGGGAVTFIKLTRSWTSSFKTVATLDVLSPEVSTLFTRTMGTGLGASASNLSVGGALTGIWSVAETIDGFSLITSTGTALMGGTIRVYGYEGV